MGESMQAEENSAGEVQLRVYPFILFESKKIVFNVKFPKSLSDILLWIIMY